MGGDTGKYDPETQTTIEGDGTVVYFNPEKPVSRAEFLKMLLFSAGFDDIAIYGEDVYWAKDVVNKAIELALIKTETTGNEPNESFYEAPIQRYEAAYALYKTYIEQRSEITVPSNLYEYNENVSCERNTRWKSSIAFTEQNMFANQIGGATTKIAGVNDSDYIEGIYQMYLNGVMEGDENREFGTLRNLTKAEAAKILEKSLFTLDEGLKNVKVINEGAANYIDFSLQDTHTINQDSYKSNSKEFYFVAPKTEFYLISEVENCTINVYDENDNELIGVDNLAQTGKKYLLNRGEKAYIKLSTQESTSTYEFKIQISRDNELVFTPKIGGKYIYSSNPEEIKENHLGENGNMLDNYENLEPGTYTYMAWYHNGVVVQRSGTESYTPIYTDVLFNSTNAEIKINRLGLQVFPSAYSPSWTGIQAYSDFLGKPIHNDIVYNEYDLQLYEPRQLNLPYTYTLSSGSQSKWLSDIYKAAYNVNSYPSMDNYNMPIYIVMEFEVVRGSLNLSTVAYKTTSDKTQLSLQSAPYVQDVPVDINSNQDQTYSPTWKGIADSMPYVEVDLAHTIEADESRAEYLIPMEVANTFGITQAETWVSNVNPQNDTNVYQTATESSILGFDYVEGAGARWRFDTKRTSLRDIPNGYSGNQDEFVPNDILPYPTLPPGDKIPDGPYKGFTKHQISISQGNYGVENVYNITIANDSDDTWKFNYRTDSKAGVVVGISVNGDEMEYSCAGSLNDSNLYERFVGRTVSIPAKTSVDITVSVVLTTADTGLVGNEFCLNKEY